LSAEASRFLVKGAHNPLKSVFIIPQNTHLMAASKTWRRLMSENQVPNMIAGVRFQDGTEVPGIR
jgi:hypothetical protein